jgi:hypothetical protein
MRETILALTGELIAQQEARLRACATRINPRLTPDDVLQPHDFPELARDPGFNYEDGVLAGLRSADAALRRALSESATG